MRETHMAHKFLMHARRDSVGVAVDTINRGEEVEGVVLEDDSVVRVVARDPIPLGHKIAVVGLSSGVAVLKYGQRIGTTTADIQPGQHVHIHNLKSARW